MKRKSIFTSIFALFVLGQGALLAQVNLHTHSVEEVLAAMTLEEKARLVVGNNLKVDASEGNGMLGAHARQVPGAAGTTQAIARLGIPASVLTDGPAGVRIAPVRENDTATYYCTGFPVGTALACTWNTELVEEVGRCIGNEVLEYGCDVLLAPGMNIHRSPLCGRNFEYFSEDPFVTGKIAAAYIRGVQSQGVGTSMKHFAVNSQETARMKVDEVVSQRVMREIYLKGFEIAVREAEPWTIMSSYNRLNGVYTQESRELLTTILRDEWGFDGIVMTDWTGTRNTAEQIKAGNDLMEPGNVEQVQDIINQVDSGVLPEADLDTCVVRILRYLLKTPAFKSYKASNRPDLKAHAAVTRRSATEGMVLLKNANETLPMKGVKKVSVFGITSYNLVAGGSGSGDVNKAYTIDLMTGLNDAGLIVNSKLVDLYNAYRDYQKSITAAKPNPRKVFWGTIVFPEMAVSRDIIDVQAQESDMAIITLGRQSGEGMDRVEKNDFLLSDVERDLLSDVCSAFHLQHKKVIVVLNMGNVIETASWKALPDAILLAWQPGQEGGYSIADVLTGKANPSGKLTMTWPVALSDIPSSANFPNVRLASSTFGVKKNGKVEFQDYTLHSEGLNVGYRYFNTQRYPVSYPFGFGLSYTSFQYSHPKIKAGKDGFTATITVTNTGKVAGKEVVQLYVSAPDGGLDKPACELKAFAKTRELKPGESETLSMYVSHYDLASYNEKTQSWETPAGKYRIKWAAHVEDVRAEDIYKVTHSLQVKCHDVLRPSMPL